MNSLLVIIISSALLYLAYQIYGKYLSQKVFQVNSASICPSQEYRDNMDFVPTNKFILFGHHFTSIAGLGPIIGPAVGIIWGWIPALLWVVFGSIFFGSIHDFGSMMISLRGKGKSIGDLCVSIINSRVRVLFLFLIFFTVLIVIAIFALIISILFQLYPQSIIPVFLQIPIAIILGRLIYSHGKKPLFVGLLAVLIMYLSIVVGAYIPVTMPHVFGLDPIIIWIFVLLAYAYVASILPVQFLLQPRDYINSFQLIITMILLFVGIILARPIMSAPMIVKSPQGASPIFPTIFVIIACGAVSGFHSLVSSGTSSKQCDNEKNAMFVSFGSMLTEGILAILVIIAIAGGLGMGLQLEDGMKLSGLQAFNHQYIDWNSANGLSAKLNAFVTGATNIIKIIPIPELIIQAILGVFLVSFAATTLDSATRIQRYVVTEIAESFDIKYLANKYIATLIAVSTAFILAFCNGSGKGALILWPLFGTVNQLLAVLTLFVISIYLFKQKRNYVCSLIPMFFMLLITGWAMANNFINFFKQGNWLLFIIAIIISFLEIWMIIEGILAFSIYADRNRFTK